MLNPRTVASLSALKKRVGRFLDSRLYHRGEIADLIRRFDANMEVAIFGGMLRDLSMGGNTSFWSDVDLVVAGVKPDELARSLEVYRPARNSFGGYRIFLRRWRADVWPLEATWAFRAGQVRGNTFRDLIHTTFFNWDAIVYEVSRGGIHCLPGYLRAVRTGLLDINLELNPSPIKTVVRTLRFWLSGRAALAPRLATYLATRLTEFTEREICASEAEGYERRTLDEKAVARIKELLERHLADSTNSPFASRSTQLRLRIAGRRPEEW